MKAIDFRTTPCVTIECGASKRLGTILRQHYPHAKKVAIVTDHFLYTSGLLKPALDSLQQENWSIHLYHDVIADPPEEIILSATADAKSAAVDIVVGFGGGSSMDVAKLMAVLLASDQPLAEMYGIGKVTGQRLPLVQIPTTAGTGSEVTPISIVTTGKTTKSGVVSPKLYADVAILDAELTVHLPPQITAATGIDAMVHALEAYTSQHLKNPLSDMLACKALELLSQNILTCCQPGEHLAARESMLLGAMLAGQAFANAPVAAVHALAYPLGGIFHVPHGLSNSLVLPHVVRFNAPVAHALYAELADVILPNVSGSSESKTQALITYFETLAKQTGIPTQLRQVGVKESDCEQLASDAMLQTRLLGNNPREVRYEDALAIYHAAF